MPTKIAIKRAIDAEVDRRLAEIPDIAELKSEASGDPSRFPALNRTASEFVPDHNSEPGATRYSYRFSIEGNVEGDGGEAAQNARDELYLALTNALPSDPEIFGAGLVEEFTEGATRFGVATLASRRSLSFVTEFTALFPADLGDPSILS